jgi:hypothetical protein
VALGQVFLRALRLSPVDIIPPLRHSHLSRPHEVCDSADQAAHYHTLGPKLGTLSLTQPMAVTRERSISYFFYIQANML